MSADLKGTQGFQNVSAHNFATQSSAVKWTAMRRAAFFALVLGASLSYLVLSRDCFREIVHTTPVEGVTDLSLLGPVGTVKWYECEGEGILPGAECGHIMYALFPLFYPVHLSLKRI